MLPIVKSWALAGSPGGLLALSGMEFLLVGEPRQPPTQIRSEGAGGLVAFLDDDHLVTAQNRDIVDWAVREAGSDVPDPYIRDTITTVAVDPRDPSYSMAGTQRGRVLRFDGRGSGVLRWADPDPDNPGGSHDSSAPSPAISSPVHQLARLGDDWLIAAHTGAYRLAPSGVLTRLCPTPQAKGSYMCWTVSAVDDDAAFAWRRQASVLCPVLRRSPLALRFVISATARTAPWPVSMLTASSESGMVPETSGRLRHRHRKQDCPPVPAGGSLPRTGNQ